MGQSIAIFGVSLEHKTRAEILEQIEAYMDGTEQKMTVTPNPEMLVLARRDARFKEILNSAAIRLVDGFGIVALARLLYGIKLLRYQGVDAVQDIIAMAARQKKKVFLLGGNKIVLEKVIAKWSRAFPALQITGAAGPRITIEQNYENSFTVDEVENQRIVTLIQQNAPDIVLAGFGHGKQELWLASMLPQFKSVRLAMGVGGTFDYLSGAATRAPLWMRVIGLEWLYRLYREPRRIRRIYNAVVLFPLYALYDRFFTKETPHILTH